MNLAAKNPASKRSRRTDIGNDAVRGFGKHHSRVDFEETERVTGDFIHPADLLSEDEVNQVQELFRKLLFSFFRLDPAQRNVVCHRITGLTWKQIGYKTGVSYAAAEKRFRTACAIMPELAVMFPKPSCVRSRLARRKTVVKL